MFIKPTQSFVPDHCQSATSFRYFAPLFQAMIKIGVLGTGHLGKIHLKLIREIRDYELIGFYDPNDANAAQAERELP